MPFDAEKEIGKLVIVLWRVSSELDDTKLRLQELENKYASAGSAKDISGGPSEV